MLNIHRNGDFQAGKALLPWETLLQPHIHTHTHTYTHTNTHTHTHTHAHAYTHTHIGTDAEALKHMNT